VDGWAGGALNKEDGSNAGKTRWWKPEGRRGDGGEGDGEENWKGGVRRLKKGRGRGSENMGELMMVRRVEGRRYTWNALHDR